MQAANREAGRSMEQAARSKMHTLVLILGATVCAYAVVLAAQDLWRSWTIRQHNGKRVRIGVDHKPPSYIWDPASGASGYAVDVLNRAATNTGVQLEWVYAPKGALAAFERDQIDLWPAGYARAGVYPSLYQSRPWSEESYVLLWEREKLGPRPQSTDGRRMAFLDRKISRDFLREYMPNVVPVPAASREEAMKMVCDGQAEMGMFDLRLVESVLLRRPKACEGLNLEIEPQEALARPMSIFASQKYALIADILRDEIDNLVADGSLSRIADR